VRTNTLFSKAFAVMSLVRAHFNDVGPGCGRSRARDQTWSWAYPVDSPSYPLFDNVWVTSCCRCTLAFKLDGRLYLYPKDKHP
jgi:hypothetical protein